MPIIPHIHRHRRRRHPRRRQTSEIRKHIRPIEASRRQQTAIVRHSRRVHIERHEPRGAGVAPVAAVRIGHGVETAGGVVVAVVVVHADAGAAAAVHHWVEICCGAGGLVAAGVGGEDHVAVELGHYAVLLVHEEGVWGALEAWGEGGGVLADGVGLGELLLWLLLV